MKHNSYKIQLLTFLVIILSSPIVIYAQSQTNKSVKISGELKYKSSGSQLTLSLFQDLAYDFSAEDNKLEPAIELRNVILNNKFNFYLKNITSSSYIFMNNYSEQDEDEKRLIYSYYVEPGDDIFIKIKKINGDTILGLGGKNGSKFYINNTIELVFSGIGSEKYQLQADLQRRVLSNNTRIHFHSFMSQKSVSEKIQDGINSWDSLKRIGYDLLDRAKPKISKQAFQVIRANFIGAVEWNKLYIYFWHSVNNKQILKDLFYKNFSKIEFVESEFGKIHSPKYIQYINYYNELQKYIKQEAFTGFDASGIYKDALDLFGKPFADRALLQIMLYRKDQFIYPKNFELVNTAARSNDPYVQLVADKIKKVIEENKSGSKPNINYELTDSYGKKISLDQFKGKVLFVDFWYTGCGPCTDYYTQVLKEVEFKYHDNKDIVFVTVSIDRNFEGWKASVNVGNYTGSHAINLYTNGLGGAHPLIQKFNISGYPTPIIFDREGKIFSNDSGILRKKEGLILKIEEALKIDKDYKNQ